MADRNEMGKKAMETELWSLSKFESATPLQIQRVEKLVEKLKPARLISPSVKIKTVDAGKLPGLSGLRDEKVSIWGLWDERAEIVYVADTLTVAERCSTIVHELVHAMRYNSWWCGHQRTHCSDFVVHHRRWISFALR